MYFDLPGPENTRETVNIAVRTAKERKISHIVAATTSGATALVLAEEARSQGYAGHLVCVTHVYGFKENGKNEVSEEKREEIEKLGVRLCSAAHALSGSERSLSRKFQGIYPVEIIANSLRMLGQGTKVCVEIAAMALDAGLIPHDRPVIALAGTGRGADTASILSPGYSHSILDSRIHEILCKPR